MIGTSGVLRIRTPRLFSAVVVVVDVVVEVVVEVVVTVVVVTGHT